MHNPQWNSTLNTIINKVKKDLGLKDYTINANLYKLLIYEKGGFFLEHKDSEKEKGMFGTLVVDLPSKFTGGELLISFDKETVVADFANSNPYAMSFASFYTDCNHKVKEVTSGYRVCLVYNLIQSKNQSKIEWSSIKKYSDKLASIFQNHDSDKPYIILLGHQYTPTNFSYKNLKLNDRLKAEVIIETAKKLGFYSNLCLVTSYKVGAPEYSSYYDESDDVMDEVYDENLEIKYWDKQNNPILNNFSFEEEDLITSFELDTDDPIVKDSEGYMGNYGPEIYYWYHYGAIVLWSPSVNVKLFPSQDKKTKVDWIKYFNSNNYTDEEKKVINQSIQNGLINLEAYFQEEISYTPVIDWLIHHQNEDLLLNLNYVLIQTYFKSIDTKKLFHFLAYLAKDKQNQWIKKVAKEADVPVIEKLLSLLKIIPNNKKWNLFVLKWANELPSLVKHNNEKGSKSKMISAKAFVDLFAIEKNWNLTEDWSLKMAKALFVNITRDKVHIIVNQQLLGKKDESLLRKNLKNLCVDFLQKSINNKPLPPKDWTMKVPKSKWDKEEWDLLKDFLISPTEQVFDYKQVKADRTAMYNLIRNTRIDLTTQTIKKGSPHTLRIIKTQASYERALKKWEEDGKLLDKVLK